MDNERVHLIPSSLIYVLNVEQRAHCFIIYGTAQLSMLSVWRF